MLRLLQRSATRHTSKHTAAPAFTALTAAANAARPAIRTAAAAAAQAALHCRSLHNITRSIVRQSHPMYTAAQNEGTRGFSAQAGAVPVAAGHDTAAAIDEAAATISAATTTDPASVTVTAPSTPTTPTSTSSYPRRRSSSAASSPSSDPQLQSTASSSSALPAGTKFALTKNFIDKWRHKKPPFGYNGLGELVYRRTYSRKKNEVAAGGEGANEQWFETVERVVNGTYNMQKAWIEQHDLGWNAWKAQKSAQEMFERIFSMKFLPPGRGLWAMGSPITETRGLFAALNNCLTMDQQILTSEGFLFHEEFAARAAAGKLVEVACFHEKSQSLTYESIGASDVLIKAIDSAAHPKDPSHQIVDFACDDDKHGNNAALSCTADHDAYLRFSVASNLDHGQKDYRKMHAGEVLKAEHQKEAHEARVLTLAANGMAPRKDPPPVFAELGLVTEDQRSAFCELYGYWLRDGSPALPRGAISFSPTKQQDVDYLKALLARLPLELMDGGADGKGYSIGETCFDIHERAWVDYFAASYAPEVSPELPLDSDIKSAKRLPGWVLQCLTLEQSRCVLRGLRFADGAEADGSEHGGQIFTSSARFRDEVQMLAMHAGYSACWQLHNEKPAHWTVLYTTHEQKAETLFKCTSEVKQRVEYEGNVWCVRVPTSDRLIITRKAKRGDDGIVNWATRPCVVGNCAFVTTEFIEKEDDKSKPFTFLMDASMLGVGVGFDTKGAGKLHIKGFAAATQPGAGAADGSAHVSAPSVGTPSNPRVFVIPDTREGWVDSLRMLLNSYIHGRDYVTFDYSVIRPFGTPIKGFGGVASGPSALKELLDSVRRLLEKRTGSTLTITDITDIMNMIGRCVVAGNVRRTAEIAFGSPDSDEYLDLKNYTKNPQRGEFGWTSNNSVFANLGMKYNKVCDRVRANGEPGFAWLENMRNYGRMNGTIDRRDHRVSGGNPCLEQSLESYELCCLVETFPTNHSSYEDFQKTLKYAYLYAKTVTLGRTHWPETNRVMLRNRRIGCSVSGVAQFISQRSLHELRDWLEQGYTAIQTYDQKYSDWFAIPRSIKTTSVKPSGTVSLLAGATPGMHYPESRFYIRRMRLSAMSELVAPLQDAGYPIEPAADGGSSANTVVVEIPVDVGAGVRTASEVPMWEQLSLAAFLQRHWADNQVSCTVTFDPATEGRMLEPALDFFQYQLKGISFLPKLAQGAYKQMPYEAIDEAEYQRRLAALKPLHFADARVRNEEANPDRFCGQWPTQPMRADGDLCTVDGGPSAGTGEAVSVADTSADPTIDTKPHPHGTA